MLRLALAFLDFLTVDPCLFPYTFKLHFRIPLGVEICFKAPNAACQLIDEKGKLMENLEHVKVRVLPDGRLDRPNAAKYVGRSPKTLAEWARLGLGPRSFLVGGRRYYHLSELQRFTKDQSVHSESN